MKSFNEIIEEWKQSAAPEDAARELTLGQVDAFEEIVSNDDKWIQLLDVFKQGRLHDAWLAVDWPKGFDELVLCAPMCKMVEWECAFCHVGKRQNNFSCADDNSLFGYIAVLLALEDRQLVAEHLQKIKHVLTDENVYWDMGRHEVYMKSSSH